MKIENKICLRTVIKIDCCLDSPLLIGSGENEKTDSDQLLTADGMPFIPGSAMAGAMRSYLENVMGRNEAASLFGTLGWIQQNEEERKTSENVVDMQSRIYVYDSRLNDYRIIQRDGVRLNERKTAEENMKYDMEAIEPGVSFCTRLEILIRENDVGDGLNETFARDMERIRCIISGMESGGLRLGARGNRGFGKLNVLNSRFRVFRMDSIDDFEEWLNWNWDDEFNFSDMTENGCGEAKEVANVKEHCLTIPLRIKTTLMIRDYSTQIWSKEDLEPSGEIMDDYGQLTLGEGTAVIPGSSWAGAIRSYIAGLVQQIAGCNSWQNAQKLLEPFWGSWESNESKESLRASRIIVDETRINGGHKLPVMRNAVDRFTGGSAKGALFRETLWAGGTVNLTIHWSDRGLKDYEPKALCGLLMWAVQGLRDGFLTVGGETGVGRGIFELIGDVHLDGQPIQEEKPYLLAASQWCRQSKKG
ncbi:RAMP superfamily CRISPR-associated protein [Anaerolentibacter hominis]|uniref:RAMP superfamily CRISPR-associated protein n=1 Tax=Anaerolentibacter hominis TaxID=3079009 RepID=UPI0031B850FE